MERNASFKILIAYETFSSGLRAKEVSERLEARLHSEFEMSRDIWKFELLNHPQLCEQAASEAAEADMVIMAARRANELPTHVQRWIESWVPQRKGHSAALVALLDEPEDGEYAVGSSPIRAYLQQVAEESHMDFFCQVGGGRQQDFEDTVETIHRRVENRAAVLHEIPAHGSGGRDWGIND